MFKNISWFVIKVHLLVIFQEVRLFEEYQFGVLEWSGYFKNISWFVVKVHLLGIFLEVRLFQEYQFRILEQLDYFRNIISSSQII